MGRRVFRVFALLSWVILALLLALWVRSFWVSDRLHSSRFRADGKFVQWEKRLLTVGRGAVAYRCEAEYFPRSRDFRETHWMGHSIWPAKYPQVEFGSPRGMLGIQIIDRVERGLIGKQPKWWGHGLLVPLWAIAIPFAIIPLWTTRAALVRRQRRHRGQCEGCGYDVRFSRERCPECGMGLPVARGAKLGSINEIEAKP
jgi:hypothetical protein